MNLPTVTEPPCPSDHPTVDAVLVLKPELVISCVGEFTFKTFLRDSDGETLVTTGLTYSSLSPSIVTLNATTGVATLLAAGVGTVSVTDADGRVAAAQVEVVGNSYDCCQDRVVATLVLVDNSKSMESAMEFYPGSRLDFAKAAAFGFMDGMRLEKDLVGLARFNLGVTLVQAIGASLPSLDTVQSIPQSVFNTDMLGMLKDGMQVLSAVTSDRRVLVIFSDGEHCVGPLSAGDWENILLEAANFKASGGIIVCCGCAASGNGFDLLQSIASGGFFFNPVDSPTTLAAAETLVGLMCYYCGGLPASYGYCLDQVLGAQTPIDPALPLVEF